MRKVFVLLLLFCAISANAQVSNAWKTEIESVFQHMNRTPVTTGLLNDYGIYFTNIDKFNGIPSDTNYIELGEWQLLYTSLYSCRFNANIAMNNPADVFSLIDSLRSSEPPSQPNAMVPPGTDDPSIILFAALHYKYEQFKSNAVPNLVYVSNSKIYDTPGRATTPYEIKEAFAAAPTRTSLQGSAHTFVFRPDLFYTNTGKTISTFKVDFGDGTGYQTLAANIPTSVIYETEGIKTIHMKITYTDNSYKESRTKIKVVHVEDQQLPNARYTGATANIDVKNFPLTDFSAPKVWAGRVGKAKVTIEYTNPEKEIRKPLIMVEGFDPWKITSADKREKNYSFEDFISLFFPNKGINVDISYSYNGQTLSDALEENDYDLIFVDFDDGTDYIQRNAYLVENIIQWVNSQKKPYNGVMQKNVVMGASMGGLVARYALRDMELSTPLINHDTRLYVSFDTPHQGANFPLGFQAMVSHLNGSGVNTGVVFGGYSDQLTFGNISPELGNSYKLLNSPAARQMLFYSVVGTGNSITIDNSIHDAFMADYVSKGYPQLGGIRNLVIANGSECGTNQGFEPHAEFINDDTRFRLNLYSKLLFNVFGASGSKPGWADDFDDFIHNLSPFRTDLRMQINLNALPSQSVKRVYRGRIYIKKNILWGLITITTTLFDKSFDSQATHLPIDNNGGGIYDLEELASNLPVKLKIKRFCFIPTFSALDIGGGQQPITINDVTRSYSPSFPPAAPKNVKAANFFANPSEGGISNEVHTQVTLRNGRWLFQEIVGEPAFFSCSINCVGTELEPTLVGSSPVCTSGAAFTLNNAPAGTAVTWAATPSSLFAPGYQSGTGASALVKAAGSSTSGSGTITFTIPSSCSSAVSVQQTTWVGKAYQFLVEGPTLVTAGSYHTYNVALWNDQVLPFEHQGVNLTNVAWSFPLTQTNAGWNCFSCTGEYRSIQAGSLSTHVTATIQNTCGSTSRNYEVFVEQEDCPSGGCEEPFLVYPNPSSDELSIVSSAASDTNTAITLKDSNGDIVYTSSTAGSGSIRIPVHVYKNGVYHLLITRGKITQTRHIVINR